ncbi:CHAT domain-containing protein [Nocardia barduliensis]|uniref:CHAT domain-containing protein n=1 Tax=Nocardia barduliensis TaxID=2736643 RepID=UPI0015722650|nr:CHAT domain-containing protein [Nocardia barduliensis]
MSVESSTRANSGARATAVLRIEDSSVRLDTGGKSFRHSVGGPTLEAAALLAELAELRARRAVRPSLIHEVGIALGESFLDGQAGVALGAALAEAAALGNEFHLSIETRSTRLSHLPWEALVLPDATERHTPREPLGLQPDVFVHRGVTRTPPAAVADAETSGADRPTRFRIVVAIASPENGRGSLLNYEVELEHVLAALSPAIDSGAIDVEILNWGTADAIRAALAERPTDILHISSHGIPGYLCLETATGDDDLIDADGVIARILPEGGAVPFLMLSACHTGRAARAGADASDSASALAASLVAHGAPGAVAMTDEVSDRFSTALAHQFYRAVATDPSGDPVDTFCRTRRELARRFADDPANARLAAEWVIPTVFAPHDRSRPRRSLLLAKAVQARPGTVDGRRDFVGRRAELRGLLGILTSREPWVVLSGLSGIGKTALAREAVRLLGADVGHVALVTDHHSPDRILDSIWGRLCSGPQRESFLSWARDDDPTDGWRKRLGGMQSKVLSRQRITLVLDGVDANLIEDPNAGFHLDAETSEFIEHWTSCGGNAGLIITSRKALSTATGSLARLHQRFLGPLSNAETAKLILDLPAISEVLARNPRNRASIDWVGGHAGALRRIEELLVSSEVSVDEAVDLALRQVGVDSELDRVAARWTANDPVGRLVRGLTVYRVPVDRVGLDWQVAEDAPETVDDVLLAAERPHALPVTMTRSAGGRARETPLEQQRERALRTALTWSLVYSGFDPDGDDQVYAVPNAVKAFLTEASGRGIQRAHLRAANYWRWREDRRMAEDDFELSDATFVDEIHYHLLCGAGPDAAAKVVDELVLALFSVGTPDAAQKVILLTREVIRRPATPALERCGALLSASTAYSILRRPQDAVAEGHRAIEVARETGDPVLGAVCSLVVAAYLQRAGDHAAAIELIERCLARNEGEQDLVLQAYGYALASTLAGETGDFDGVLRLAGQALELAGRADTSRRSASGLQRLQSLAQMVAYGPGSRSADLPASRGLLEIVGAEAELMAVLQLGSVHLMRGNMADAERAARRATELADNFQMPFYVAAATFLTGSIELVGGKIDLAEETLRRARLQAVRIGDGLTETRSLLLLGDLSKQRGDLRGATDWYHRALDMAELIGNDTLSAFLCLSLAMQSLAEADDVPAGEWVARAELYGNSAAHPAVQAVKLFVTAVELNFQGDTFEAARVLQTALDLLASTGGSPLFEAEILRFMAINAIEGDDRDAFLSTLQALSDIVDRTGNLPSRGMLLFFTALRMGDEAETPEELAQVRDQLDQARAIFESIQANALAGMVLQSTLEFSEELELSSADTAERAQRMQNLARVVGEGDLVVDAVEYEITRALEDGRVPDARTLLDDLLHRRLRRLDAPYKVDVLIGRVLHAEGDLGNAWDHFHRAHEDAMEREHWGAAVDTAGNLADLAVEAQEPALAMEAAIRAFVINAERDDYSMTLRLVDGLAELSDWYAQVDESWSWSAGLALAARESPSPFESAVCLRRLGGDALEREESDAAESWLLRSLSLNEGSSFAHDWERHFARTTLVQLLLRQERYPEVVEVLARDIDEYEGSDMDTMSGIRALLPDEQFLDIVRRTVGEATYQRIASQTQTPWWEQRTSSAE